MEYGILGHVYNQVKNNEQESMRNETQYRNLGLRIDDSLAYLFYHFLRGDSNKLPTYSYLQSIVFDNERRTSFVSSGCGMSLDENMNLEYIDPLSECSYRIYKISPLGYDITECIFTKQSGFLKYSKDAKSDSEFSLKRIEHLVRYFKGFSDEFLQENGFKKHGGFKRC